MTSAEISTAVARLTGMESGDEIRAIVSDAWKEAGKGELKRLAELLLKEVVVHEDRIEMTVNCAGFAPMTQEVWNDTEKD